LYDSREGAEAELQRVMVKNGDRVTKVRDLPDCMTQLRKIRSAHHPDRNNPDSDHDLYQAVIEKMDRMDFISLLFLLALAALAWFWFNSLRALEIARNAGKQACLKADVQFLDDTVASTSLGTTRDESGRRVLRRTYRFEFTETGNSRLEGQVVVIGDNVESVRMDPYQILD